MDLLIPGGPAIPEEELSFTASRSGGPGGQHVNKVSSRITLFWDLERSQSLTPEQKDLVHRRLRRRISAQGVLRLSVSDSRSQAANRKLAVERFVALLASALAPRKARTATRPTAGSREKRLTEKKGRSRIKRLRGAASEEEG
ncbi:MAG TPA: alternative ribosome rescue aminoacyl-tRNA hydrolase ArfB [Candidatus Polarisedimenticolaceae bacterium]|nr:alternative ribosome rescue aminoacyl-tRNA hydrolase ArfB [Candidatus Polarisedimenticolaceae bacterium]